MGQKAKTVNTVSGDVVAEAEKRGAVTKGPDLSFLAGLEEGEGEVGAPLVELMAELSPGPRVSILGALHPSTYQARGLPMATRPRGQTRDTLRYECKTVSRPRSERRLLSTHHIDFPYLKTCGVLWDRASHKQ